mmetsp:Transcript_1301/g.4665  ORF Transcript_1301/g.4665 Transcript_1301/m.4665 type:complete len:205 (+) Transcript_1301:203-817(+)
MLQRKCASKSWVRASTRRAPRAPRAEQTSRRRAAWATATAAASCSAPAAGTRPLPSPWRRKSSPCSSRCATLATKIFRSSRWRPPTSGMTEASRLRRFTTSPPSRREEAHHLRLPSTHQHNSRQLPRRPPCAPCLPMRLASAMCPCTLRAASSIPSRVPRQRRPAHHLCIPHWSPVLLPRMIATWKCQSFRTCRLVVEIAWTGL